nr:MAG TPA: hypothetical protein [Caudoviricetes sp.]
MCYKVCYCKKENPRGTLIPRGFSVVRMKGLESLNNDFHCD